MSDFADFHLSICYNMCYSDTMDDRYTAPSAVHQHQPQHYNLNNNKSNKPPMTQSSTSGMMTSAFSNRCHTTSDSGDGLISSSSCLALRQAAALPNNQQSYQSGGRRVLPSPPSASKSPLSSKYYVCGIVTHRHSGLMITSYVFYARL